MFLDLKAINDRLIHGVVKFGLKIDVFQWFCFGGGEASRCRPPNLRTDSECWARWRLHFHLKS
jgi:hypothetical protein